MSFIFEDNLHDAENNGARRGKNVANPRNNQKRAALGVITNQVRVQPFRSAKAGPEPTLKPNDENAFSRPAKVFGSQPTQAFNIFVDDQRTLHELKPANIQSSESNVHLTDAIMCLQRHQEPISNATVDTVCIEDSPMALDESQMDEEPTQGKVYDRESIITMVPEYAEEIYKHLREAEMRTRPKAGYMKKQQDITNSMRSILVDWLVEVAEEYKLHRETLFLAVNYIDRFLSTMAVQRGKLQLVGAASMFLASKYEEIYPPDVGEFAYITDDTYTKKQVLRMEHLILKVLKFDVSPPTINWFVDHFLQQGDCDDKTKSLAMFLAELSLVECDPFLKYLPSTVAAACVCLARYALGQEAWPSSLVQTTGYEMSNIVDCLKDLHQSYLKAEVHPQQAVMDKYKNAKHHEVSDFSKYAPPASLAFMG